jgi:hypothetical protein
LSVASDGFSQTVQVERAGLERTQYGPPTAPGITPQEAVSGYAAPSPNDADLGEQQVLKRIERYQPWTATLSVPVFWTSNAFLTDHAVKGDLITAPIAAVFYQPRLTSTLFGVIDVRQQFFYYNKYNSLDFGSMDVEAGLTYIVPSFHNLALHGEYDFNRLTSSDRVLDEFFQNHAIILNAELPFQIGRAQRLAFGTTENISLAADHDAPQRSEFEGYASYSLALTRMLTFNAVGRIVDRVYYHGDRNDVSEIIEANATLQLTPWWAVSANTSFANNDSNHDIFDYKVVDLGGAVTITVRF